MLFQGTSETDKLPEMVQLPALQPPQFKTLCGKFELSALSLETNFHVLEASHYNQFALTRTDFDPAGFSLDSV